MDYSWLMHVFIKTTICNLLWLVFFLTAWHLNSVGTPQLCQEEGCSCTVHKGYYSSESMLMWSRCFAMYNLYWGLRFSKYLLSVEKTNRNSCNTGNKMRKECFKYYKRVLGSLLGRWSYCRNSSVQHKESSLLAQRNHCSHLSKRSNEPPQAYSTSKLLQWLHQCNQRNISSSKLFQNFFISLIFRQSIMWRFPKSLSC